MGAAREHGIIDALSGITFTYGGLRADQHGRALDEAGDAVRGLYVCGEMLGALLSGSYRVARD
jgi:succinate dehydrogenase/fumarate reductase flavoprotein subunit